MERLQGRDVERNEAMRDTIELAREAGFEAMRPYGVLPHVPEAILIANACVTEEVKRLVALVRADEREACAKVCEDEICSCCWDDEAKAAAEHLAAAIRARGNI
jgi:hypothetical protein